ncbi:helix-turn-helix domain-containing protein [Leifsonia poae]|uniref:helix-turn-helix domain-containing protein n=1 Tax=Leifsonia poae TaxID=110933 RepID=UPI003D69D3FF
MVNEQRQRGHDIDATGRTVASNLARIRKSKQLSLKDIETATADRGRRLSFSGLSKIENGDRRVDVDDLMVLAQVLDVSPLTLMLPTGEPDDVVDVSGGKGSVGLLWEWALTQESLAGDSERNFQARSLPGWLYVQADYESKQPRIIELHYADRPDGDLKHLSTHHLMGNRG